MITTQILTVKVRDDLVLNAGTLIESADEVEILPPEKPMFDQLIDWLAGMPCKVDGFPGYALGIGATALCIRYGTWLSFLMDDSKPVDSRAHDKSVSMIFDDEMQRINIEASWSLACLLERMSVDEFGTQDICLKAYEYLPMPQKKVNLHWGVANALYTVLKNYSFYTDDAPPFLIERGAVCVNKPFRALSNTIINAAYRNAEIEDIHAGLDPGYSLTQRRFTSRQSGHVLRGVTEKMSAIMAMKPIWRDELEFPQPWPDRVAGLPWYPLGYPSAWSLDAQSSSFRLRKEWM